MYKPYHKKSKPQHFTVLGYLLKLKYHAYCENWKDFVAIANYAMCSFSSLIVEIMRIASENQIPYHVLSRIRETWSAELGFLCIHDSDYKVTIGMHDVSAALPVVKYPYLYRAGNLASSVDVLPYISWALDSDSRLPMCNDIYKHQRVNFERAKLSDLPDCIESYYLLRAHHKLDACKMLRRIYWASRTRMMADYEDISLILHLCKWYDIVFDFVLTYNKRVSIYCENDDMQQVEHDVASIVKRMCR